jgi:integrase
VGTILSDITPEFLKSYEAWMKAQGRSTTTVSMYLRALRTLINKAIAAGEFSQEAYPFGRYKYVIPSAQKVKKVLTLSEIGKIYNYKGEFERSRDWWIFLYYAHGMNMYDFCLLKYENIKGKWIVYRRKKTIRTDLTRTKLVYLLMMT